MIAINTANDKRIALFGLGGSGIASALSLQAGGAELFCHDDNPESVSRAADKGLNTVDLHEIDFSTLDEFVLSPGVPLTHPKPHWSVELAQANNVPIIGDVELFAREHKSKAPNGTFIAITGTNGKSTTTALIGHVISSSGRDTQVGGNIGTAVLLLEEPTNEKIYVIECSSYQIDLAPTLAPTIGILLNLAPDHLDRHGNMQNYASIKKRLVEKSELAIIGTDDDYSEDVHANLESVGNQVVAVAGEGALQEGVYLSGSELIEVNTEGKKALCDLAEAPALIGNHNGQNAAAAWAACRAAGLSDEEIIAGFKSFPGLAHRMEQVGKNANVLFVNDSKATNSDAAARALSSFENIYWIAGGLSKEDGIEPLRKYFPKIKKAYLIGEASSEFAATLGADVPFEISGTLEAAVSNASKDAAVDLATGGDVEAVVLLSPACASFDQFGNFELRGEAFKNAVFALPDVVSLKEAS